MGKIIPSSECLKKRLSYGRLTAPILVVHAKDDPMAKYGSVQKFIARTNAKTAIFETGGHLITGHGDAVSAAINKFIEET